MLKFNCFEIVNLLDGEPFGDINVSINSLAPIEKAGKGDLSFYYDEKYVEFFNKSMASCIIISDTVTAEPGPNQLFIKVDKPYDRFVQLLKIIESGFPKPIAGIHPNAVIGSNCIISDSVTISANCIIGDNCRIGSNSILKPGVIMYDDNVIGENTIINSNVTLYNSVNIGNNCIIHAGAVIGSDGFGYIEDKTDGSYDKVPQLGNVVLEDYVEIGANSTIDCALIGSTTIRKGTKIDNLVHIAHNCEIGENTGIAAQAGVSGSVTSGKRNRFGGQVGIAGHLEIPDDVTILAQSGVSKSIPKSGIYFGSPIKEHLKAFKIEAVLRKLPELASDVNKLRIEINKLNEKNGD